MSKLVSFGSWGVILMTTGPCRSSLPDHLLNQAVQEGFTHFKYIVVRDAQQKLPEYSTQRCPGGFPIMTVLLVSRDEIDTEHSQTLPMIKAALKI